MEMERSRNVHPDCRNSSNPYHQCNDSCFQRIPGAKHRSEAPKLVAAAFHAETSRDGLKVSPERNVHPKCVNASNPYHRCTDSCFQKIPEAERRTGGDKLAHHIVHGTVSREEIKEGVKLADKRNVNPNCRNASNPYHECGEHCSGRNPQMNGRAKGVAEESKKTVKPAERNVHLKCINASNPYHVCAEYCYQRIREIL